jgi:hypothetical protein
MAAQQSNNPLAIEPALAMERLGDQLNCGPVVDDDCLGRYPNFGQIEPVPLDPLPSFLKISIATVQPARAEFAVTAIRGSETQNAALTRKLAHFNLGRSALSRETAAIIINTNTADAVLESQRHDAMRGLMKCGDAALAIAHRKYPSMRR